MNEKIKQAIENGKVIAEKAKISMEHAKEAEKIREQQIHDKFVEDVEELKSWLEERIYQRIAHAVGNNANSFEYSSIRHADPNKIPDKFTYKHLFMAINKMDGLHGEYEIIPEDRSGPAIEIVVVTWESK